MRIFLTLLFFIFTTAANAQTCIGAPPLSQITIDNTIDICLATTNANEISALALRQTLKTMTSAIFQNGNISSGVIELTNFAPLAIVDLATILPVNGLYLSGSGAIFSVCPLTYGYSGCLSGTAVTYTAQYLKATAVQPNNIAEYMVVNDCDLNSGRAGPTPGAFNDNKVCQYNSVVTGSSSGNATWVQANNLEIGVGDSVGNGLVPFKTNTELDVTNSGPDCAVGVRNCYNLYLSGNVVNSTTAFLAIAPTGAVANSHYGILINGNYTADAADIEVDGSAAAGICIGCLSIPSTHSQAAFWDNTTSTNGLWLNGTYTAFSIQAPGFNVGPTGRASYTSATITGSTPTTAAGQIGIGSTVAAASNCGSLASAAGCLVVNIAGTTRYIPYY